MKHNFLRRLLVMTVTLCLILTMIPLHFSVNDVEAVSGIDGLTCSGFISNSTARNYIDKMMRYYLNNNSSLRNTLDNGLSVIFMFEGGSDNYWEGSIYENNAYDVRNQAVCIVVKKNSSGNAYIAFYNESSCSIPGQPTWCTGAAYSGSTTLMDGIYSFHTTNHTGPYAALQVNLSSSNGNCYYTPPGSLNGYQNGASGINIHTRSSNIAGGSSLGWVWSAGCQLISWGNDTGNEFNNFMKAVCNISWNPWINYSSKTFNTWSSANTWVNKGYYVVDRQLGLTSPSGTKYGSGSLINLYNTTALTNITAKSTAAMKAAGADKVDYLSQCTYYPSYGKVKITGSDVWTRTLPCYSSTDSSSTTVTGGYYPGDVLTVTGLYKNTLGEYWYRTTTSSGSTVYFNGAYADFTEKIISDIKMTGHTAPNGHLQGTGSAINGDITSQYNRITEVSGFVYKGFGTSGNSLTGSSVSVSTNSYKLAGSAVDESIWMNLPENGPNTLQISVKYINYYVSGSTLKSNTGTVVLATDYFMVVPTSVNQSSCSHKYQDYVIKAATCTTNGESIKACPTCGHISGKTTTAANHSYGDWVITNSTCTTEGSKVKTCSKCGDKVTEVIPFGGHSYTTEIISGNCQELEKTKFTCSLCGHSYTDYTDQRANWSEEKPTGVANESLIEAKTQYRYSDYSSQTSYNATLAGYTVEKTQWEKNQTGTVNYVKSWPSGFNKSHSLYSTYNKSPKNAVTNTNDKTEINSDKVTGYIYYHWCYADSYYSAASQSGDYNTFHAYYSTTAPSSYQCDTSDMSYKTSHSTCSNSDWYFAVDVNQQTYTTYKKLYTHSKWSDWSDWSDEPVTASSTRKVESRTLYRYIDESKLGEHVYENGICKVCQRAEPEYYLFGYINGANYACEEDAENIGIYKFEDGKLTAEFTENSYVAFKTGDNLDWFMTDGYPGESARQALFYNTNKGINAEKMFVPKGVEVEFTLINNGNGSFTLSYSLENCQHKNHNISGQCTACGTEVEHTYVDGVCVGCGKAAPVYYLIGFINGADYEGNEYRFAEGTLTTEFSEDSYVFVKTADNSVWYMTDGYQGEEANSAILYDAGTLDSRGDKLFVPKGKSVEFTLKDNEDGTFTLSYTTNICKHIKHNTDGICLSCGEQVDHSFTQGFCTVCGRDCEHEYNEDNICSICQKTKPDLCLFGFINGEDYNGTEYKFDEDGKLLIKFTDATYVAVKTDDDRNWYMTDTYQGDDATSAVLYNTKNLDGRGDKLFVPRGRWITFTIIDNLDDTYTLSYTAAECEHDAHNVNGICLSCGESVDHNLVNGECTICGSGCKHNYENGFCTDCRRPEPQYYLFGFINGQDYYGEDYRFEDGKIIISFSGDAYVAVKSDDMVEYKTNGYLGEDTTTAVLYNSTLLGESADKLFIPGNREVIIMLIDNGNNTITLSYRVSPCQHPSHNEEGVCTQCSQSVSHNFEYGYCTVCYAECEHIYANGRCKECSMREPDYYLFGFINGAEYACDSDADNIGIYKFTQGKLTVVFTQDSFVGVKTEDNMNWFMTDGYQGADVTSAVLYNTKVGINADKLFVPRGRVVTFTLESNGDGTYTLSYTAAPCAHHNHNTDGECISCAEKVSHDFIQGVCVNCSAVCKHSWEDDSCSVCNLTCEHNWIDGRCYICSKVCTHSFEDGVCTVCSYECEHNFSEGHCAICDLDCEHNWIGGTCFICNKVCVHEFKDAVCTTCSYRCKHNYINGKCTVCSTVCGHKWSHGDCIVCDVVCEHPQWTQGVCDVCSEKCVHTWSKGECTNCSVSCSHNWEDGKCKVCSVACEHTWVNSSCVICKSDCKHSYKDNTCTFCSKSTDFYLIGEINNETVGYGADYLNKGANLFVDGTLTMTFTADSYVFVKSADNRDWYMSGDSDTGKNAYLYNTRTGKAAEMMYIPAGVKVTFTLTPADNDTFRLSYTVSVCQHAKHDTLGKCIGCRVDMEHSFSDGICSVCSLKQPGKDMYLFGTINGADYGFNNDATTIGEYKFIEGRLTVTFTEDSYVAVKSFDNKDWYMAQKAEGNCVVLYNTRTGKGNDLLLVPGGREISLKLSEGADGTYILSYEFTGAGESVIVPKYTTLSFENGIRYQTVFRTENMNGVTTADMGLIIFTGDDKFTSAQTIYGVEYSDGYFIAESNAIHPKTLGDAVNFRIFAKLSDGTYVYSDLISFSAERYAYTVLNSKYSSKAEKALMVSLLNFGAESQLHFGYNTDKLVNSDLTSEQKALVKDYFADMADKVVNAEIGKQGEFVKKGTGFMLYPTAHFSDTMFTVTYNMKTKLSVSGEAVLYYWTADTYNSESFLTKENAAGVIPMSMTDTGAYTADVSAISINELDDTIYAAVVYESEGTEYCSGVVAYSMAEYCKVNAQNNSSSVQNLAKSAIVFGYYAEKYSANS